MINNDFYDIIDKDIAKIIKNNSKNEYLNKQNETNKKSFAFLIWFLKLYMPSKRDGLLEHIVDGDDDCSSDIIFDNKDQYGKTIFYVIQAKWFMKQNINSDNRLTKEIKASITDFNSILNGEEKLTRNEKFNIQYKKITEHKNNNGKIRFIYLTLCTYDKSKITEMVNDFKTSLTSLDIININDLKKLYIELNYKEIKIANPLEIPYIPQENHNIDIIPGQCITIDHPFKSRIFLVKPKTIYNLFEKYGQSLFFKNIRNPLDKSNFNSQIRTTLLENPVKFWYYNNGITAITQNIEEFYLTSDHVTVRGIQIINGAQTVYTIYKAYLEASDAERLHINDKSLITFRVLTTGGKDFDVEVTRYTNSQNPICSRDFYSNEEIQSKLQNDFFCNTNIWYETRRGEFRRKLKNINIVSNEIFAQSYLAYFLKRPLDAKNRKNDIFKADKDLYDKIFNDNTKYDDLLISYYLKLFVDDKRKFYKKKDNVGEYNFIQYATFEILSLFNILIRYVHCEDIKGVNNIIVFHINNKDHAILNRYYDYIRDSIQDFLCNPDYKDSSVQLSRLFKTKDFFKKLESYFLKRIAKLDINSYLLKKVTMSNE